MIYGSVCSGIEAATVAWHPLGWKPAFFSEIEKFPRAVLQHHYPDVPMHGDFTTIRKNDYGAIDLLVGGTPCQDFSVAGLRKGITGDRGNLTLEFIRLVERKGPTWVVWENVPGVLSIDGGRAFGAFLGGLAECGYGFAYRVLDAQNFGVPQRRRRVFVIGYFGDWRPAAAVLFERESLYRDITPRREAGEGIAEILAPSLRASGVGTERIGDIAHSLRGEGFDASEDGSGRGIPLIPHTAWALQERDAKGADSNTKEGHLIPVLSFDKAQITSKANRTRTEYGLPASTLSAHSDMHVASFKTGSSSAARGIGYAENIAPTLEGGGGGNNKAAIMTSFNANARPDEMNLSDTATMTRSQKTALLSAMAVRRLTPRECERLQGFPDDYTKTDAKTSDSARYKALGNSMAVPVMAWLGQRIQMVDDLL